MKNLPILDIVIILVYLVAMVLVGVYFSRKNKSADEFTRAAGRIPGWAIGISIYATFLSSNTFLGVPGKAFGGNWNAFAFSLSMPFAAWLATKYFVPFYRSTGEVSAYTNLEKRFGTWARTYAVVCFLLTQLARIGSIFFGISLTLQALTGYSMVVIMVVTGICIVIYTVMGGIEAVIWTEVVQGILKTIGALIIIYLVVKEVPGGFKDIIDVGIAEHKFSLGTMDFDFVNSSFWVVLLYGFFINLNNFGMDQNYVQRYHTASSPKEANKSVWLCVWIYVPVSLLFFIIGTCLYTYYLQNPALLDSIKLQAASEQLGLAIQNPQVAELAATLKPSDYGDKIMPHFMVYMIPTGLLGLIVSAILSAAMSTISSGMNASATVFTEDIYKRYFNKESSDKNSLKILYIATVIVGVIGMICGIAMIGIKSLLDVWWTLSGIFAGGMLGLFLLGLISKKATNSDAIIGTIVGICVILWMTFSYLIPENMAYLRNPLHANMIIVVGTLTIFLIGNISRKLRRK
ncbi:sodium:solute symporter [Sphingobacterium psychroaquaticum]|uniref:Solute:Na+ symporter, SSS family n=1 Tax=Sphingobacterium psychroaquaticum TaxID=561061 RepID=A0A1X7KTN5_9SPHI|nr:sodium:solute symporter [Sphingobacterium psychroaquaticum]SMG44910.1 solute:Na+ symporter, SSS family [Sphingobacterium psychroaquaticum]